ncbi:MAG: UvrD-helicase domain-containing protein, partial [Pseudomonadota bacterium]
MSDDRDLAPDDDLRAAEPPDAATQAQIAATTPDASAWVAANAGSGKTSVLTRRVARLLLGRCPPQRILCLTYTRAAAAEMQARLNRMLGEWAMMEDAALARALAELGEPGRPDAARLAEARRLFAAALETPGGLKIQTIHAFCASLLRRFPLEAGAPPGFAELDEAGAARLLEDLREQAALAAEAGADPAFDGVAARAADLTVAKLMAALPGLRDGVPDAAEAAEAALRRVFQMSPGADPSPTYALIWENIEPSDMRGLAAALAASGGADGKQAPALLAAAEARDAGDMVAAGLSLERFGLTAAGTPRSTRSFPTKATRAARPSAFDETLTLIDMAESLRKLRLDHAAVEASAALHALARRVLAGYAREKAARGALDFEDLIRRTLALVSTASAAAWALRRLDGGLDHVLVDEAQDTSPAQWKIIEALTQEFFAGAGARLLPRTVFAVGDEKQSIYSFQGAAPREFGAMREHFAQLAAAASEAASGQASGGAPGAAAPFARRSLDWSFRSAPAILRAVDAALASEGKALASDGAAPSHRAFLAEAPGLVELWPPFEPAPTAEAEDPLGPVDAARPASPKMRLAEAVAAHVDDLLREGAPIWDGKAAGWRPMRPGDVMILLRARGRLAPALIAGLKGRGVPVAGADRLHMLGSLAVQDCLSLLRATLDRRDDLSAAEALRSPFCGMSEGALEDLATTRAGAPLLAALADRATEFPHAAAVFAALAGAADFDRPYDLLQTVLIRHGGRARLRARAGMGPEQEEAVDALLAQALAYESVEAPTLPGF